MLTRSSEPLSVYIELEYRTYDPAAIYLAFMSGSEHLATWCFARDLLKDGVVRPAGVGDVEVQPVALEDETALLICLKDIDGQAWALTPLNPVKEWIKETYALVPAGDEFRSVDWDRILAEIMRSND
ncbi:SsgA family sporulation/cell division regulator [Streptomyces djakartensis]|uniref:SsgA family sporulation/cell division regulator n=1 Tax=Streptomyces djakartensis TaxID=68193 RepID=UPI0034DF202B